MIETDNVPIAPSDTIKQGRYLTSQQRAAIIAEAATGKTQAEIAERFGVHVNSVSRIVCDVRRNVPDTALDRSSAKTRELVARISDDAKLAIHASVQDREDVHKAAGTGLSWLKGTGELAGDGGVSVFVTHVSQLPADMRAEYVSTDDALEIEATPIGLPDHNQ